MKVEKILEELEVRRNQADIEGDINAEWAFQIAIDTINNNL